VNALYSAFGVGVEAAPTGPSASWCFAGAPFSLPRSCIVRIADKRSRQEDAFDLILGLILAVDGSGRAINGSEQLGPTIPRRDSSRDFAPASWIAGLRLAAVAWVD